MSRASRSSDASGDEGEGGDEASQASMAAAARAMIVQNMQPKAAMLTGRARTFGRAAILY